MKLKLLIRRSTTTDAATTPSLPVEGPAAEFIGRLAEEYQRAAGWVIKQYGLLLRSIATFAEGAKGKTSAEQSARFQVLSEDLTHWDAFVTLNAMALRKIIKKGRRWLPPHPLLLSTTGGTAPLRLHASDCVKDVNDDTEWDNVFSRAQSVVPSIIVYLSQQLEAAKASEGAADVATTEKGGKASTAAAWQPPDTFVRRTIKYWVRPTHALAVKLKILPHLPVLEVAPSPPPPIHLTGYTPEAADRCFRDSQLHNYLSSVYFDTLDGYCYHRRIQLEEGALLLRIRWYGGESTTAAAEATPVSPTVVAREAVTAAARRAVPVARREHVTLPKPARDGSTVYFVEMKTHHEEAISGQKSTKERFPILGEEKVVAFLTGATSSDTIVEDMAGIGLIKASKVAESKEVAGFIQKAVLQMQLHPRVRTVYHRTAFQRSDTNDVRISFDLPLMLLREDDVLARDPAVFWPRLRRDEAVQTASYPPSALPLGVLEIKTSDEPPPWVNDLLETGWLTRIDKFSKFQHAIATYFPSICRILPYWFAAFDDLVQDGNGGRSRRHRKQLQEEAPVDESTLATTVKSPTTTKDKVSGENIAGTPRQRTTQAATKSPRSPNGACLGGRAAEATDGAGAPRRTVIAINNSDDTTEGATLAQPLIASRDAQRAPAPANRLVPFGSRGSVNLSSAAGLAEMDTVRPSEHQAPRMVVSSIQQPIRLPTNLLRAKVEPKVFFANERTMLHWMFAAVLLVSISMTLMALNRSASYLGLALGILSIIFVGYALALYRWRLGKLLNPNPTQMVRFDDRFGPWLLGASLITASIIVVYTLWTSPMTAPTFTCQQAPPTGTLIPIVSNVTELHYRSRKKFTDVATATQRVETCLSNKILQGRKFTTPSATTASDTTEMQKDLGCMYYVDDTCRGVYLTVERPNNVLAFNVAVWSPYYPMLQASRPSTVTLQRAYDLESNIYTKVTLGSISRLPNTTDEVNVLLRPWLLPPMLPTGINVTLVGTEITSSVTYGCVLQGFDCTLSITARFGNEEDRASYGTPQYVDAQLELFQGRPFTLTALRHAQSLMESLFVTEQVPSSRSDPFHTRF